MPTLVNHMTPAIRRGSTPDRPPVDWTGHHYKAVSELRVTYPGPGRDVLRGREEIDRRMPTMPGIGNQWARTDS